MLDYEGAKCVSGHSLEIVSEGYGICATDKYRTPAWWAWAFTRPALATWGPNYIRGKDDRCIDAWATSPLDSKEEALAFIQADIDARRAMPFDEETERARLMPV